MGGRWGREGGGRRLGWLHAAQTVSAWPVPAGRRSPLMARALSAPRSARAPRCLTEGSSQGGVGPRESHVESLKSQSQFGQAINTNGLSRKRGSVCHQMPILRTLAKRGLSSDMGGSRTQLAVWREKLLLAKLASAFTGSAVHTSADVAGEFLSLKWYHTDDPCSVRKARARTSVRLLVATPFKGCSHARRRQRAPPSSVSTHISLAKQCCSRRREDGRPTSYYCRIWKWGTTRLRFGSLYPRFALPE